MLIFVPVKTNSRDRFIQHGIFLVAVLPLLAMLLTMQRWWHYHPVFCLMLVAYCIVLYGCYRIVNLPRLVRERKYIQAGLFLVAVLTVSYLFLVFSGLTVRGELPITMARNRIRWQGVWISFLCVTLYATLADLSLPAKEERKDPPKGTDTNRPLILTADYQKIRIDSTDILYVESFENYVRVHLDGGALLDSKISLAKVAAMLPEGSFLRIHRSYLVSVARIHSFTRTEVTLSEGSTLPIGRTYTARVQEALSCNPTADRSDGADRRP